MPMGYDVAELLAEIRAKNEEIDRLAPMAPNNFTEAEAKLVVTTMRDAHTPESAFRCMSTDAAAALQKLQVVLDRFETERLGAADFAASLTNDERLLILERRRKQGV